MQCRSRELLRAFLPLLSLCLCSACGDRGESAAAATTADIDLAEISNNAPPTLVVAAVADAQVGATFDYQPVAQDPESDTLRFTAANLPSWASLDATSGRVSGTPGPTDVGVYESISITVADETHKVATAPFSITVNPAELGSGVASLQWEMPPSKVSGEPLDDLVGYRILYGRSSSDLDHSVLITDPTVTSYQFSTLTSGVWYFAVVAVNSSGLEGPPTTLATKSI
jgi:Putative Ig domain